jgi:hypothetical protein
MGFMDSRFHFKIQLINANLISIHHQPHGLVSKIMCHVLVANPFVLGLPRLVYCLLSTCNYFGHLEVRSQWELIWKLHKEYLEEDISPL